MSPQTPEATASTAIRNTVLGCIAFMIVMLLLFLNNAVREKIPPDDELRAQGIVVLPKPRALGSFELVDEAGGSFTNAALEGTWTFAYFGFTHCPDVCPVSMSVLGQARRQLADEGREDLFEGRLFTVDPRRDTPEVLASFVHYFHEDFGGITGTRDAMADFASQLSVAFAALPEPSAPDGYVVDHTGNIVLINPRGHYHGYIRPPHTADQITFAYKALAARM
ncbi:MAG: SCO family protein [Pseudomonadales bacterium]|nr:SCO family protein [Pseudomonadales bacterium]